MGHQKAQERDSTQQHAQASSLHICMICKAQDAQVAMQSTGAQMDLAKQLGDRFHQVGQVVPINFLAPHTQRAKHKDSLPWDTGLQVDAWSKSGSSSVPTSACANTYV